MNKPMLSQSELKEILSYDPLTGVFTWKVSRGSKSAGSVAGNVNTKIGYRQIGINGRLLYAHRLAWLYIHGVDPVNEIDHENGDKSDNRYRNLRDATSTQNSCNIKIQSNNTSGCKGVSWAKYQDMWHAYVQISGKRISRYTSDFFEACCFAHSLRNEIHGEFSNHGMKSEMG